MINWSRVRELRDEVGPEDFDEVVSLFIEEVDEAMARLEPAQDHSALEAGLHFLKGSALSLGFEEFAAHCQDGETASTQGRPDDVDLALIKKCYQLSKDRFLADMPSEMLG